MAREFRWLGALLVALLLAGCVAPPPGEQPPVPPREPAVQPPPPPPEEPPPPPPAAPRTYEERLEQALRQRVEGSPVRVQRQGGLVKVSIPNIRVFSPSGDEVQPAFAPVLDGIAAVLREYDRTAVMVKGFTDSTSPSSFEHNQELSRRRAENLGTWLLERDIAPTRVRTAGYGPRQPVASNASESGRALNRRMEIDITPLR